ncbi:uncharacterized protein MONOS_14233 [Monocercomonoides exilis]|uniref:uncharacterized protein n=1 Tax=Monocercomonoides exilis TaxID=2049356 RepID=UPI0035594702|nr:hypothetical protein MONOS_14233 [Monocercomonoides exilis]|eukprot:MONOS_14233.1-p1 / transcript=MONOS_14233.1 / gene=MONOS_14233 / organism=Monocercomonoides_exilis_PA203 / gene_product=unspecified product / transcript_product=unspecified product / location=Mono_scaffold00960:17598-18527(+) / protein_length=153 / sequence_SO=supercontig / SO=protein_coding / is_pseudo=false
MRTSCRRCLASSSCGNSSTATPCTICCCAAIAWQMGAARVLQTPPDGCDCGVSVALVWQRRREEMMCSFTCPANTPRTDTLIQMNMSLNQLAEGEGEGRRVNEKEKNVVVLVKVLGEEESEDEDDDGKNEIEVDEEDKTEHGEEDEKNDEQK